MRQTLKIRGAMAGLALGAGLFAAPLRADEAQARAAEARPPPPAAAARERFCLGHPADPSCPIAPVPPHWRPAAFGPNGTGRF